MNWVFTAVCLLCLFRGTAQRTYKSGSVLASGNWYKFAVKGPGIYVLDVAALQNLGVNVTGLASGSIRLYGNGGAMLPEAVAAGGVGYVDDLTEVAISVEDGGDGVFGPGDRILFYATGPHVWKRDSVNRGFTHVNNIYSDEAYYFLTIGGSGKRVGMAAAGAPGNVGVTGRDWRVFHELDSINFLASGKQWVGEEFAGIPGGNIKREFIADVPFSTGEVFLRTSCVARSIGVSSRFTVNGSLNLDIPAVTDGNFDVFGRAVTVRSALAAGVGAGGSTSLSYVYMPGGYNSQGWLDWWELNGRGELRMDGLAQLDFRDWRSVGTGNRGNFVVAGAPAGARVWDVTDAAAPVEYGTSFVADCSTLREYVAFDPAAAVAPAAAAGAGAGGGSGSGAGSGGGSGGGTGSGGGSDAGSGAGSAKLFTPRGVGKVSNQNLHRVSNPDMIIVADPAFLPQAARLASFHLQQDRLQCLVVSTGEVYNEFAGGEADATGVRDYIKMFYDRSGGDSTKRPRYLLLFGAGSYDYKDRLTGNTNFVPAYESESALDPLNTFVSDDYFAFLRDGDDANRVDGSNLLDIGVGRIPVRSVAEAAAVVDKIVNYSSVKTQGPWRNELNLIADDGDQNLHLQDAEAFAATVGQVSPATTLDKIYLDAYKLQATPAGSRYPDVNQAILSHLYNGTLLWNYTGHGSNARLSNSVILDQSIINSFNNADKLPLFVTATCDFTPYDNPVIRSIGADLLVRPSTGAIGLMTTTRLVFASSNKAINDNYLRIALVPGTDGRYLSLGEAMRQVKNYTYRTETDAVNNRKFTLIGDPALTLAFPRFHVKTTAMSDTLRALNSYTVSGAVTDLAGAVLGDFNGTVYATIYDKPRTVSTLGNNPASIKTNFQLQDNVVYKGKVSVTKGLFQYSFVVPKDINYQYGHGRSSYYAAGGSAGDAGGEFEGFFVGGSGSGSTYTGGPAIQAYLNDEKFVDGGITNQQPLLLLHLTDSLGINVTGTGIGHDMTAILDNNAQEPLVLNGFYEADLNTHQKGTVKYPMPVLSEGEHTLLVKVFNVANISSQAAITFRVVSSQKLTLTHVLNYPNPFTTHTTFWFEHNRAGEDLSVLVQVLTVSGKLVKSIRRTINTAGNRSSEIDWDGRDDYGAKIGRGVYIYLLRVRAADGSRVDKMQKLYIL